MSKHRQCSAQWRLFLVDLLASIPIEYLLKVDSVTIESVFAFKEHATVENFQFVFFLPRQATPNCEIESYCCISNILFFTYYFWLGFFALIKCQFVLHWYSALWQKLFLSLIRICFLSLLRFDSLLVWLTPAFNNLLFVIFLLLRNVA